MLCFCNNKWDFIRYPDSVYKWIKNAISVNSPVTTCTPQCTGMQPVWATISCSHNNFIMIFQTVQDLSCWQRKTHTHKWTLLKTVSPRYAIATQVIVTQTTHKISCNIQCPNKRDRQYFDHNFDRSRQLFLNNFWHKSQWHTGWLKNCKKSHQYLHDTV